MSTPAQYSVLGPLKSGAETRAFLGCEVVDGVPAPDRPVVVVWLPDDVVSDPKRVARLQRETSFVTQLDHPNIIVVHGLEHFEEGWARVVDFVDGEPLSQVLRRAQEAFRPLDPRVAARIVVDVCDAVHYAHEEGQSRFAGRPVVHGGLRPDTIMVAFSGRTKVTGYGASVLAPTQHGTPVRDKFVYFAPEQIIGGKATGTTATDIYAIGAVLYELLAGKPPFADDEDPERAVLTGAPPILDAPGLAGRLGNVAATALAKRGADRFESVEVMREAIVAAVEGEDQTLPSHPEVAELVNALIPADGPERTSRRELLESAEDPDVSTILSASDDLPEGVDRKLFERSRPVSSVQRPARRRDEVTVVDGRPPAPSAPVRVPMARDPDTVIEEPVAATPAAPSGAAAEITEDVPRANRASDEASTDAAAAAPIPAPEPEVAPTEAVTAEAPAALAPGPAAPAALASGPAAPDALPPGPAAPDALPSGPPAPAALSSGPPAPDALASGPAAPDALPPGPPAPAPLASGPAAPEALPSGPAAPAPLPAGPAAPAALAAGQPPAPIAPQTYPPQAAAPGVPPAITEPVARPQVAAAPPASAGQPAPGQAPAAAPPPGTHLPAPAGQPAPGYGYPPGAQAGHPPHSHPGQPVPPGYPSHPGQPVPPGYPSHPGQPVPPGYPQQHGVPPGATPHPGAPPPAGWPGAQQPGWGSAPPPGWAPGQVPQGTYPPGSGIPNTPTGGRPAPRGFKPSAARKTEPPQNYLAAAAADQGAQGTPDLFENPPVSGMTPTPPKKSSPIRENSQITQFNKKAGDSSRYLMLLVLGALVGLLVFVFMSKEPPAGLDAPSERHALPKELVQAALQNTSKDDPADDEDSLAAMGGVDAADAGTAPETAGGADAGPPKPPEPGSLRLDSDPPVTIFLRGKSLGRTPVTVSLPPGRHRLRFSDAKTGLNVYKTYRVRAGASHRHRVVFGTSKLVVLAPDGASVFLNSRSLGKAPLDDVTIYEGRYLLRVSFDGMSWSETFDAPPGQRIEYKVHLK